MHRKFFVNSKTTNTDFFLKIKIKWEKYQHHETCARKEVTSQTECYKKCYYIVAASLVVCQDLSRCYHTHSRTMILAVGAHRGKSFCPKNHIKSVFMSIYCIYTNRTICTGVVRYGGDAGECVYT